jgi:hypothetical protein
MLSGVEGNSMTRFFQIFSACGFLVAACSTGGGGGDGTANESGRPIADPKPDEIAGGQSGTDGAGSYYCDLKDATTMAAPVDEVPMFATCAPAEALSSLKASVSTEQGSPQTFDCGSFGRFEVQVDDAIGAEVHTGLSYSDTGERGEGTPCVTLSVNAPIHVVSLDDTESFEATRVETDHLCWTITFEGARADGATASFHSEALPNHPSLTIQKGTDTVECSLEKPPFVPVTVPIGGVAGDGGFAGGGGGGVAGDASGGAGGGAATVSGGANSGGSP